MRRHLDALKYAVFASMSFVSGVSAATPGSS